MKKSTVDRLHLVISGDVQGVGFRAWTVREARELGLTGWVKNRDDGAVEVTAEGPKEQLEEFLRRARKGPDVSWVEDVRIHWLEATNEYVSFGVIY